jgi:hypothetical protein
MAGTVPTVRAHAARSVLVSHANAAVVAAVRSAHTVVGTHRWCGDSGALVGPDYGGIACRLSEVRPGAVTAAAAGAQAMRLVACQAVFVEEVNHRCAET